MKRREFIRNGTGLILLAHPLMAMALTDDQVISGYKQKETANKCQSVHRDGLAAAILEVNPDGQAGLLAHSVGCRFPHKHVFFLPGRYLNDPRLVAREADSRAEDGSPVKIFKTSLSFDMSDAGLAAVGSHQHMIFLTMADVEQIRSGGIDKIAYQRLQTGQLQVGHFFHLST